MVTAGSGIPFSTSSAAALPTGRVNVLYAGSLVATMNRLGPAFEHATGYRFVGYAAGSTALASDIKAKTYEADVFVSAGTTANASLEGAANGNWESWYAVFGSTPLVLGYNPKSKFAKALLSMPWYRVVTEPGFLVGRTDPKVDPKGVLSVTALEEAARRYRDPALSSLAKNSGGIFPEETLVGRLQAGQLDAGFFYGVEAKAAGIPTVNLGKVKLDNPYTVSIVRGGTNSKGAKAFVSFLLGEKAGAILRHEGLRLVTPAKLSGARSSVPRGLRKLVR